MIHRKEISHRSIQQKEREGKTKRGEKELRRREGGIQQQCQG